MNTLGRTLSLSVSPDNVRWYWVTFTSSICVNKQACRGCLIKAGYNIELTGGISYVMLSPDAMLLYCWPTCDTGPTLGQHWFNASCLRRRSTTNTRHYRKHMLDQCWADVEDVVPAFFWTSIAQTFRICLTGVCLGTVPVMTGDPVDASG